MKKPTYTLSIPQPCHERWDEMTPTEKGRFCASCQKQVIDFSGLSDREVIQLIEQSSGKVCGRLHPQQLDRPMVFEPWAQRASVRFSGFFAGLMMLSSADTAFSQNEPIQPTVISQQVRVITSEEQKVLTPEKYTIKGRLTDARTGEPIVSASLTIIDTELKTSSDSSGFYILRVPIEEVNDEIVVRIFSPTHGIIKFSTLKEDVVNGLERDFIMRQLVAARTGGIEVIRTR